MFNESSQMSLDTLINLGENILIELVASSDDPPVKAAELVEEYPTDVDIIVGFGDDKESLQMVTDSFVEKHGGQSLIVERGSKFMSIIAKIYNPFSEGEEDCPDNTVNMVEQEETKLSVYSATPFSNANAVVLVLAKSEDQAVNLISRDTNANTEYLDIDIDHDYDGCSGEPRILDAIGFTYSYYLNA